MSRQAFPGFMGHDPVRAVGSVTGQPDVGVDGDGKYRVELGPPAENQNPKFRILNVAGDVIWSCDDQTYVFQETKNGEDILVLLLDVDVVCVPTTGATLYVLAGGKERSFYIDRKVSPFHPED